MTFCRVTLARDMIFFLRAGIFRAFRVTLPMLAGRIRADQSSLLTRALGIVAHVGSEFRAFGAVLD